MTTKEAHNEWAIVVTSSDDSDEELDITNDENGKTKVDDNTTGNKLWEAIKWIVFILFLLGIAFSAASLTTKPLRSAPPRLGLAIWQWSLLITALLAGPVLSLGIKKFILFYTNHCSNEVYYVAMLIANAWAVLYFSLILLAWIWVSHSPRYLNAPPQSQGKNLINQFDKLKLHKVTLTLTTVLLGSFLWLIKDFLVSYEEKRFRTLRFLDRIKRSLLDEYRIVTISGKPEGSSSPKCLYYQGRNIFGKEQKRKIELSRLLDVKQGNVSSWTMKKLVDEIIEGRALTFLNSGREVSFESEKGAIEAGKFIFTGLVSQDQRVLGYNGITKDELKQTLSKYFTNQELPEVMQWLLEGADATKINKEVFKMCTVRAWREREALIRALQSNKKIFQQLNLSLNLILVIVIFVIWLVMLKVEIRRAMLVVGSAIVGSAFVFGEFCKKVLDSFALIYVTHPFDVGDCCLIENTPVIINEINLLTTVAFTMDHEKRFYSNSTLNNSTLSNYTRSGPYMGDSVVFNLDINTPEEKIDKLNREIKRYIKENAHFWRRKHWLVVEFGLQDTVTVLKATLHFQHTITYHYFRERQQRKSKLIVNLKKILNEQNLTLSIDAKVQRK